MPIASAVVRSSRPPRSSSTARARSIRISKAAQKAFNTVNPEITVVVDNHGTGGGFSRYLEGEVDIVDASRAAKADEESKAKAQGIDWSRFLVGYDGITLVVNPKNDFVKSLSVEQLKTIWAAGKQGQDLERRRPALARPQDHPLFAGQRFGDVRVLHRGDRRQGQEPARRRPAKLRRQHAGQRRRRRPRRSGLFRLRLLRGQQGQAPRRGGPEWPDAQPVLPSPATIIDKTLRSAVAAALHLREELGRPAAGSRPVSQVLPRQHRRACRQGGLRPPDGRRQGGQPGDARQASAVVRGSAARDRSREEVMLTTRSSPRALLARCRGPFGEIRKRTQSRPRTVRTIPDCRLPDTDPKLVDPGCSGRAIPVPGVLGGCRDRRAGHLRRHHRAHDGRDHPGPGRPELRVLLGRPR